MEHNFEKQAKVHREFYENFLKFSLYSFIFVCVLLALLAIFVV